MIIGVPKEIKREEYRTGMTTPGVEEMKREGHMLLVESGAGMGSGFKDDEYLKAGADIVESETRYGRAELIVKVKEPLPGEYRLFRERQALFNTYIGPHEDPSNARKIISPFRL